MIIARYLTTKILFSTLAVSIVLTMVVMSGRLARYISAAAEGQLAVSLVLPVVFLRMPQLLELILPVSLLLGIMLSIGELYETNEMTVINATGVSHGRIMSIGMSASAFVALVVALFSFYISPKGNDYVGTLVNAQGLKSELSNLAPDTFYDLKNQGGTVYAGAVDKERKGMEDVFVFRPEPVVIDGFDREENEQSETDGVSQKKAEVSQNRAEGFNQNRAEGSQQIKSPEQPSRQTIIYASKGFQEYREDGGFYFVLEKGVQFEGMPGQKDFIITEFDRYSQRLDKPDDTVNAVTTKQESSVITDLIGRTDAESVAELHWRLSLPISVMILAAIGIPLSRSNPRQGRYYLLIPALILFLIYMVMLNAGKEAISLGEGGPLTEIWAVHLYLVLIAVLCYFWPNLKMLVPGRQK